MTIPDPDPTAPTGATVHINMMVDWYDYEAEPLDEEEKRYYW